MGLHLSWEKTVQVCLAILKSVPCPASTDQTLVLGASAPLLETEGLETNFRRKCPGISISSKEKGSNNPFCQWEEWILMNESEKKIKLFINKARYPQSTGKKWNLTAHPHLAAWPWGKDGGSPLSEGKGGTGTCGATQAEEMGTFLV